MVKVKVQHAKWKMKLAMEMEIKLWGGGEGRGESGKYFKGQKLLESILQIEQGGKQARIKWVASGRVKQIPAQ